MILLGYFFPHAALDYIDISLCYKSMITREFS